MVTVHADKTPLEAMQVNESIVAADACLFRLKVPSRAKARLHTMLARMGVTRSMIFPDLQNLALEITEDTIERKTRVFQMLAQEGKRRLVDVEREQGGGDDSMTSG